VHDQDGLTPLLWASYAGCLETAQVLLDNNANVQKKDMVCTFVCALFVRVFIICYIKVIPMTDVRMFFVRVHVQDGWTALILASAKGHVEMAQLLIDNNVDLETKDTVCTLISARIC
jgi:ankyrin repeat protein